MSQPLARFAMSRPLRAGVALLTFAILAAPFMAPAEAAACTAQSYNPSTRWTTIDGPRFSTGGKEITYHAVDPLDPRRIYVTNGSVIAVTTDTGCNWKETYKGPSGPGAPTAYEIRQVIAPSPLTAVALIHESSPVSRPRVELSTNAGESWTTGGAGLAAGEPEFLRSGKRASSQIYLGVDVGGGTLDLIYASEDLGATWTLRSDVSKTKALAGITDVEVDPIDPKTVWGFGTGGLYLSTDGAASFTAIPEFADKGRAGPVDVFHDVKAQPFTMAFTPEGKALGVSRNNDDWLFGSGTPANVDAADHGFVAGDVIVSAQGSVYRYDDPTQGWPNMGAPGGAKQVVTTHAPTLTITAHGGSQIFRWVHGSDASGPGGFLDEDRDISLVLPPEVVAKQATIVPDGKKVVIQAGDSKKVTYRVDLPERPRPLDVYFLVDTSSSMTRTIDGLADGLQDIINSLSSEGIDVNYGLAEFRTYPSSNPPKGEDEKSFVYKQKVDIQEGVEALEKAIEELDADGGGNYDAHLGALYQTATGAGQDLFPVGVPNTEDVPRGQQASFRDKAIRVVIHATDEKFGRSDSDGSATDFVPTEGNPDPRQAPPPSIPSVDAVAAALNDKDIKQVGLSIGYLPHKDLIEMADKTKTVAYGDGVDCDGNGSVEVTVGDPLVCKLRSDTTSDSAINLVPAVVNLLRAVQDPVPVELDAVKGEEVIDKIGPDIYESVILQTRNSLDFEVTYACSERQAGKRFPVRLQADSTVDLSALSVDALVVCKGDAPKEPPPIAPLVAPLIALAVPPPPPVPPSVAELSSASQTQAQSQAQAQGAAAQQEQEEPQLAYVAASGLEDEESLELNMTAYSSRRELPVGAYAGMGAVALAMMFGAGVYKHRVQQRTRAQRQGR
jgi:hypothetical protein